MGDFRVWMRGVTVLPVTGHVFISYSHHVDGAFVDRLARHLRAAGVVVWYDREIVNGDRWERVIEERITTCAAFVVVMSPAAAESRWVEREINLAEKLARPIRPLLLAGEPFFRLSDLQFDNVIGGRMPSDGFLSRLPRAPGHEASSPSEETRRKPLAPVITRAAPGQSLEVFWPAVPASTVAFHPTGAVLLSGGSDGSLRVWNFADLNKPPEINSAKIDAILNSIKFSLDGQVLAVDALNSEGVGAVYLLDDQHVSPQAVIDPYPHDKSGAVAALDPATGRFIVSTMTFAGDRQRLAISGSIRRWSSASSSTYLTIWDISDVKHPRRTLAWAPGLGSLAFNPLGQMLATLVGNQVRLWQLADAAAPALMSVIENAGNIAVAATRTGGARSLPGSVVFHPDGNILAVVGRSMVRLWDVTLARRPRPIADAQIDPATELVFSPDGRRVAFGDRDGAVHIWSVANPTAPHLVVKLTGHQSSVNAVAFSPDGHLLASTSQDGTIRLWSV